MKKEQLKKKIADKKAAVKGKIAAKKSEVKGKFKKTACAVLALCALMLGGCSLERADPAARSNRAVYTITVNAHGDNSQASAYIKDGLMATADGEGSITQPATQTTEQSPDVTVPGDAVSAGIQAVAQLGGKAIEASAAAKSAEAATAKASDCEGCTVTASGGEGCADCTK